MAGFPGVLLIATIAIFAAVVMQSSHAALVLIITALAAECSGRGSIVGAGNHAAYS